jgi:hypothetical protein
MKASETTPSATLSQDPALPRDTNAAGCVCPGGPVNPSRRTFENCTCEWGRRIREMLYLGYGTSGPEAVFVMAKLGEDVRSLTSKRRREILQGLLDVWPASRSIEAFCEEYGVPSSIFYKMGLTRIGR